MPKGTKVDRVYEALKAKYGPAAAAKIAQAKTGQSLETGKKAKTHHGKSVKKS